MITVWVLGIVFLLPNGELEATRYGIFPTEQDCEIARATYYIDGPTPTKNSRVAKCFPIYKLVNP